MDYKAALMAVLALLGAAGGGLGLGTQIHSSDEPEVIAYRLGRMEQSLESLAVDVRSLDSRAAGRWTRAQHDAYARETDRRLDALERLHID